MVKKTHVNSCHDFPVLGYKQGWTDEKFRIKHVANTIPWTYHLEDLQKDPILGGFYANEMQATADPDIDPQPFPVEILKLLDRPPADTVSPHVNTDHHNLNDHQTIDQVAPGSSGSPETMSEPTVPENQESGDKKAEKVREAEAEGSRSVGIDASEELEAGKDISAIEDKELDPRKKRRRKRGAGKRWTVRKRRRQQ